MAAAAPEGFALATDVAEWLVRQGVPFREAHEVAGACVAGCEDAGVELADLTDEDLAAVSPPLLTPELRSVLTVRVRSRRRFPPSAGPPSRVREQPPPCVVVRGAGWVG